MESYERPQSLLTKSGRRRQTSEETLRRRREHDREQRASESAEERELCCSLWRQRDRDRHEACSAPQREDRLQQQQQCVRELHDAETPQEREARLQQDQQRVREQRTVNAKIPLFHQPAVRLKMEKFHMGLVSLQALRYTTCFDKFSGLKMKSSSTECAHCHQDFHVPKLYSSANNMHPDAPSTTGELVLAQIGIDNLCTMRGNH